MTFGKGLKSAEDTVSIHATLAGGDSIEAYDDNNSRVFLSTPPARVAMGSPQGLDASNAFLSTPPSRVATAVQHITATTTLPCFYPRHPSGWRLKQRQHRVFAFKVSIHATLAGGDALLCPLPIPQTKVSIHATLAGGDRKLPKRLPLSTKCFYPRHPRGWRRPAFCRSSRPQGFYPRHPRGWRPRTFRRYNDS